MSNCFLMENDIPNSIVVTLPTHHHMHGVEYLELGINLVTADLATNSDALPQPNTFTRLELSVNLVFIKSLTGPSQSSLTRLTEKPRSKPHVARKFLEMIGQGRHGRQGVTQLNVLQVDGKRWLPAPSKQLSTPRIRRQQC